MSGYIYILFNEMFKFYGDNVYKIGKTHDIEQRVKGYTTSYIEPVEIKFLSEKVTNSNLAEQLIFRALKAYRVKRNREFFKVDNLKDTINIIETIINKINIMREEEQEKEMQIIINERVKMLNTRYKEVNNPIETTEHIFLRTQLKDKDEHNINNIVKFISLFYKNDVIKDNDEYIKVKLLRKFEQDNNIIPFDINLIHSNINITTTKEQFKELQKVFRMTKNKPTNNYELKKVYIGMIRNITGERMNIINSKETKNKDGKSITIYNFIQSKKTTSKDSRKSIRKYNLNNELINKMFELIRNNSDIFESVDIRRIDKFEEGL